MKIESRTIGKSAFIELTVNEIETTIYHKNEAMQLVDNLHDIIDSLNSFIDESKD